MYHLSFYNKGNRDRSIAEVGDVEYCDTIIQKYGLILDSVLGDEQRYTNYAGDTLYMRPQRDSFK